MAKIHIENGIISSSADYSLYHKTSPLATVEEGGEGAFTLILKKKK